LVGDSRADVILAASAMGASFLVSYVRAKAESLGYAPGSGLMNVGLAPREVRLVVLAVGLLLAGVVPGAIDGALVIITILAIITTFQRILHVRTQSREG
jgi:CDP-diacylglycerol--glycerol-3-phosphate 3-phosphatidyltransferase